jgi:hypothetical protein
LKFLSEHDIQEFYETIFNPEDIFRSCYFLINQNFLNSHLRSSRPFQSSALLLRRKQALVHSYSYSQNCFKERCLSMPPYEGSYHCCQS